MKEARDLEGGSELSQPEVGRLDLLAHVLVEVFGSSGSEDILTSDFQHHTVEISGSPMGKAFISPGLVHVRIASTRLLGTSRRDFMPYNNFLVALTR